MADAVGTVRVDLFANLAEWTKGLSKAQGDLSRFAKSTERIGKNIQQAGQKLTLAVTAPVLAFGGLAIKAATDANELQSAFDFSFGKMAGAANSWAETTGNAFGRSTQTMQRAAFEFNQLFRSVAPTEEAAYKLSTAFAELSSDVGSFFNISDDDALKRLRSGLAGEAEPLRRLGVFINEASVKQRAFQLGIAKVGDELTDQQKILARSSLIMEKLNVAQGDVVRTNDSTANQIRRTREEFDELLVSVGEQLLPIFNELLKSIRDVLAGFNGLDKGTQQTILVVAGLSAAVGPALVVFGGLFKAVGLATRGLGAVAGAMGVAAGNAKTMAGAVAGAVLRFTALAAVAYEVGGAIGKAFAPNVDTILPIAKAWAKQLEQTGLSADEARLAVAYYYEQLAKGKQVTEQQAIAAGKLAAQYSGPTHAAFVQSVDDAIDQAVAMDEARKATEVQKTAVDDLVKSFGNLSTASDQEIQALKDKVDPLGAALREYQKQLALAKSLGLDAAQAQKILGAEFLASVSNVDRWQQRIKDLPPDLQILANEFENLHAEVIDFGLSFDDLLNTDVNFGELLNSNIAIPIQDTFDNSRRIMEQFDPGYVFTQQMKVIEDAWKAGTISAEAYARAKADAIASTPEGQAQLDFIYSTTDALTEAATGAQNFGDTIKNVFKDILKANFIKPFIQNALSGLFPDVSAGVPQAGGLFNFKGFNVGDALGSIGNFLGFGGSRDKGGDAMPGMTYKIGAGVQEWFTPNTPGTISRDPPGASGVTFNVYANDPNAFRASERQMQRRAKRELGIA